MSWHIASVSWGKDSLAMLHLLIDRGMPLDEVVFYDTGAEFRAIYAERDATLPLLRERGIAYTELRPRDPFFYNMLVRPVRSRATGEVHAYGYGWCGGVCRWGTSEKTAAIDKHAKAMGATVQYVGIASDETARLAKKRYDHIAHPLADWGMTEADCLAACYERGHEWSEGGMRLYDVLDRVSCWCCRNKNQRELKAIHDHLPDYWQRLLALESRLGQMKRKPLEAIGGE
ncbi:phosphoadenosine phosphosulfate reductase family protein [Eggerthella sinensis]|uniref:phosphoadenosine phosphosulfate reductase domain-containing protein n=1 Tax=Eggerthella sinensis TaxID=242230 RepID=UPI00237A5AFF|nr:phosphoadenosine phosphosulfate reductase family protein [Eggerthella sinensis]